MRYWGPNVTIIERSRMNQMISKFMKYAWVFLYFIGVIFVLVAASGVFITDGPNNTNCTAKKNVTLNNNRSSDGYYTITNDCLSEDDYQKLKKQHRLYSSSSPNV